MPKASHTNGMRGLLADPASSPVTTEMGRPTVGRNATRLREWSRCRSSTSRLSGRSGFNPGEMLQAHVARRWAACRGHGRGVMALVRAGRGRAGGPILEASPVAWPHRRHSGRADLPAAAQHPPRGRCFYRLGRVCRQRQCGGSFSATGWSNPGESEVPPSAGALSSSHLVTICRRR